MLKQDAPVAYSHSRTLTDLRSAYSNFVMKTQLYKPINPSGATTMMTSGNPESNGSQNNDQNGNDRDGRYVGRPGQEFAPAFKRPQKTRHQQNIDRLNQCWNQEYRNGCPLNIQIISHSIEGIETGAIVEMQMQKQSSWQLWLKKLGL